MGLSADETDGGAAVVVVPEPAGVVDDVDVHPATIAAQIVSTAILAMLCMAALLAESPAPERSLSRRARRCSENRSWGAMPDVCKCCQLVGRNLSVAVFFGIAAFMPLLNGDER